MTSSTKNHRLRVGVHYDSLAEYGPYATLAPHDRGGRKSRYVAAVFDTAILPRLKLGPHFMRLLDFGSGTGIFAVQALAYGAEVVGIDVSWAMLKSAERFAAEQSKDISLVMTDGAHLPFADASFDRFVARESLCYVPDEQYGSVLSDIYRVMTSGANLYVLDQVSENPAWQINLGAPNLKKRSVDEIISSFGKAGFSLIEATPVRQPRFVWIYAIWLGLLPSAMTPFLARVEILWNRYLCPLRTQRWQNALFIFRKP